MIGATVVRMVDRAASRRSGDGIDRTILATGVGRAGTILEAEGGKSEKVQVRCPDRSILPKPNPIVGAGAEERFSRCRTASEAAGGAKSSG
jgi:hypothetical protein